MASKAFTLDGIDREKVKQLLSKNDENSNYFNELVDDIVNSYCSHLTTIMRNIELQINDPGYPITDEELELACLQIPNAIYFVGEAVEAVGVKNDIAKAVKTEIYNEAHLSAMGTVADKDVKASMAAQYEQIVENVYNRATKKIKQKCEAGYEMLTAIKKIISRRMQAYDLTNVESARINQVTVQRPIRKEYLDE